MTRVLYMPGLGADYGDSLLYTGMVELLGLENVDDWPYKPSFHGQNDVYPERQLGTEVVLGDPHSNLWAHRDFWRSWNWRGENYTLAHSAPSLCSPVTEKAPVDDDEVITRAARGYYDLIVLSGMRHFNSAALHEIRSICPDLPPVVLADHEDYPGIRWDFIRAFQPVAYFKRSFLEGQTDWEKPLDGNPYPVCQFYPFPFCSIWEPAYLKHEARALDLLCVFGATHNERFELRRLVQERFGARTDLSVMFCVGHPLSASAWRELLVQSRVVMDMQPLGTDTLRFWESVSSGACVISDMRIETGGAVEAGTHFLRYTDTNDVLQVVASAVDNCELSGRTGEAAYLAVQNNNKAIHRAAYLMEKSGISWQRA